MPRKKSTAVRRRRRVARPRRRVPRRSSLRLGRSRISRNGPKSFYQTVNVSDMTGLATQTDTHLILNPNIGGLVVTVPAGGSGTGPENFMYYFSMHVSHAFADLSNSNAYAALFDRYRINGVKMSLCQPALPNYITANAGIGIQGGAPMVTMYDYVDTVDTFLPPAVSTSVQAALRRQGVKMRKLFGSGPRTYSRFYRPNVLIANQLIDGSTTIASKGGRPWIDNGQQTVQHTGWAAVFEVYNPTQYSFELLLDFKWKYYFQGTEVV